MRKKITKISIALVVIVTISFMIYDQTRQVNVRSLSPEIEWIQFVNGLGEPVSNRGRRQIRTYWNELGRKYAKVHLRDGREFNIHYFHSDTGDRRRVWIEVDVDDETDSVVIRLFFGGKEVARAKRPITEIVDATVDLMTYVNKTRASNPLGMPKR